jgi:hypothetical protein
MPSAIPVAPCSRGPDKLLPSAGPLIPRHARCHPPMAYPPRSRAPCINIPSAICHMLCPVCHLIGHAPSAICHMPWPACHPPRFRMPWAHESFSNVQICRSPSYISSVCQWHTSRHGLAAGAAMESAEFSGCRRGGVHFRMILVIAGSRN